MYTLFILAICLTLIIVTEYYRNTILAETRSVLALPDTERIRRIAKSCGKLCDSDWNEMKYSEMYRHKYRHVKMTRRRCRALYTNPYMFVPSRASPRRIPTELRANFTMNGRVPLRERYFNSVYLGNTNYELTWNESYIESYMNKLNNGQLYGTYGAHATNDLLKLLHHIDVFDKRVLVIGSQKPWCEAAALVAGAKHVVTLEFGRIRTNHPKITTFTPNEFNIKYLADDMPLFDVVIAYSTLEHSGLGRYGDALNPWGDLITVAMAWCTTKPNGFLIVEVPRATSDVIVHNMMRYYGDKRLPHLTTNWVRVFDDDENGWNSGLSTIGDLARPMVFARMQ